MKAGEELAKARQNLELLLEQFSADYKDKVAVLPEPVDISNAFWSPFESRFLGPKNFGQIDGINKVVAGYAAQGAAFASKYQSADGKPKSSSGHYQVKGHFRDFIVISLLCSLNMHNTSLYEIFEAGRKRKIAGFTPALVNRITEKIRETYTWFEPEEDSFFMFAGKKEYVKNQIHLNSLLLSQFIAYGSGAAKFMSEGEARLMEQVIGKERLLGILNDFRIHNVSPLAYWPEGANHTKESAVFVYDKMSAYGFFTGNTPRVYYYLSGTSCHFPLTQEEAGRTVITSGDITPEILERR